MTNYTLAELQAMADADLNALAAELRGLQYLPRFGNVFDFVWMDGDKVYTQEIDFATNRNQSGDLLQWLTRRYWTVDVGFGLGNVGIVAMVDDGEFDETIKVPGNDARAETIAFCAAMLAMKGRLK